MNKTIDFEYQGISYRFGDLLEAARNFDVHVVAHQANCHCAMASGIARAISEQYPKAAAADSNDARLPQNKLGSFSFARVDDGFVIFNLYGQFYPGRNTSPKALESAVKAMADLIRKTNPTLIVGLPLIGCGIGGGDWSEISKMLINELYDIEFYVYVLNKETFDKVVKKCA